MFVDERVVRGRWEDDDEELEQEDGQDELPYTPPAPKFLLHIVALYCPVSAVLE